MTDSDGALREREMVAAWLRLNAEQIIGNALTGGYKEAECEAAAEALELAASSIEDREHLK